MGNPAGVCFIDKELNDSSLLQKVSKKLNISEVSFISKIESEFYIRWFSPTKEVDICGHGTIAAFEVMLNKNLCLTDQWITLNSNKYQFKLIKNSRTNRISLRLPIFEIKSIDTNKLSNVLDVDIIENLSASYLDYVAEIDSLNSLKNLDINFSELLKLDKRGLIVSFLDISDNHIYYRYFCPKLGFNEDFGTGSALSTLYPIWKGKIKTKNKTSFTQVSRRVSKGFISKSDSEDYILLETEVSKLSLKTLEID